MHKIANAIKATEASNEFIDVIFFSLEVLFSLSTELIQNIPVQNNKEKIPAQIRLVNI
tara:strand:+ start:446 stop:619 length:174 start_codon:yes stop_codon:yes gene_type:complete